MLTSVLSLVLLSSAGFASANFTPLTRSNAILRRQSNSFPAACQSSCGPILSDSCDDGCACTPQGLQLVEDCLTCSVQEGAMTADTALEVAQEIAGICATAAPGTPPGGGSATGPTPTTSSTRTQVTITEPPTTTPTITRSTILPPPTTTDSGNNGGNSNGSGDDSGGLPFPGLNPGNGDSNDDGNANAGVVVGVKGMVAGAAVVVSFVVAALL